MFIIDLIKDMIHSKKRTEELSKETDKIKAEAEELLKEANKTLIEAEDLTEELERLESFMPDKFEYDRFEPDMFIFEDSIELARESGVPEEKILKTKEDIDRYFNE